MIEMIKRTDILVPTKLGVYVGVPVSGSKQALIRAHIEFWKINLEISGFRVFHPLLGTDFLRPKQQEQNGDNFPPALTDHAIFRRDMWMIDMADFVLMDLLGAERVHIGCIAEVMHAYDRGKLVVVLMERRNPNRHAFVTEPASIILDNSQEALNYLVKNAGASE